jgi:hypothetical protein
LVNLFPGYTKTHATADRPPSGALAMDVLNAVVPVASSANLIDIHHSCNRLPGSLPSIIQSGVFKPPEFDLEVRHFSYEKKTSTAVQQFLETLCRCWFTDRDTGKQCVNNEVTHKSSRPHRDAGGNNIGLGVLESFKA